MKLRSRPRSEDVQCPYCRDAFGAEDQVVSCGGCGVAHHADCLRDELRSCATLGCEVRPEVGHGFRWGDRKAQAGGPTLTCCPEGIAKRDPLLICDACGHLVHTACATGAQDCCEEPRLIPLLGGRPSLGSILTKRTWAWLAVLALLFVGFVARVLRFDAGAWEGFFWVAGLVSVFALSLAFLYRGYRIYTGTKAPVAPRTPTPVPRPLATSTASAPQTPGETSKRIYAKPAEPPLTPTKTTQQLKARLERHRQSPD